jgi:Domain of unknown function (DUF4349)
MQRSRLLRTPAALAAATILTAMLAAACGGGGGNAASEGGVARPVRGGPVPGSTSAPSPAGGRVPHSGQAAVAQLPAQIIRTAEISLRVERGGVDAAIDRINTAVGTFGGFVESTSVRGTKVQFGRVVVRVPVDQFDPALHELESLGEVRGSSVSGRDVTAQFVDLDARLRNLRTQETVLRHLLARAPSVSATLRVQGPLSDVQLEIERLTGERNVLANRTELSTISLDLSEPGRRPPVVAPAEVSKPQLQKAWQAAIATFLGVLYGLIVALGVLIPLAIVGGIGFLIYRLIRARQRARIAA